MTRAEADLVIASAGSQPSKPCDAPGCMQPPRVLFQVRPITWSGYACPSRLCRAHAQVFLARADRSAEPFWVGAL